MIAQLGAATRSLALVVCPASCTVCGAIAAAQAWAPLLCAACAAALPIQDEPVVAPPPLAGAHALARFEGPARRLLIDLKYQGALRAGWALGRAMAAAPGARRMLRSADIIVPIPLHWRRRWARGHNQAAILAFGLYRHAERPLPICLALRRRHSTRGQVGLHRVQRAANVRDAFQVRRACQQTVRGRTVLLVDDVLTTGATAAAAAAPLLGAGARRVRLYAAAWAPP